MIIITNGKSNINVSIDSDIKELATQLLECMGLDQATAIDMFYRQIIAERRLSFQPTIAQTYSEQALDIIRRKNIPHKPVEVNAQGHIIADKDTNPEFYDWAVNG